MNVKIDDRINQFKMIYLFIYFLLQYWPSRGTETYGVMCVTLTDTQELATYVIRTFQLQRVSSAHVRLHVPTLPTHIPSGWSKLQWVGQQNRTFFQKFH